MPFETLDGGETGGPRSVGGDDWAAHLTGRIEGVVAIVRDKAVEPVVAAVRYVILGLLSLFVLLVLAVLVSVATIRILDNEVPVFHTRVWASYLIVSGIFWAAGLLLLRKRRSSS